MVQRSRRDCEDFIHSWPRSYKTGVRTRVRVGRETPNIVTPRATSIEGLDSGSLLLFLCYNHSPNGNMTRCRSARPSFVASTMKHSWTIQKWVTYFRVNRDPDERHQGIAARAVEPPVHRPESRRRTLWGPEPGCPDCKTIGDSGTWTGCHPDLKRP